MQTHRWMELLSPANFMDTRFISKHCFWHAGVDEMDATLYIFNATRHMRPCQNERTRTNAGPSTPPSACTEPRTWMW